MMLPSEMLSLIPPVSYTLTRSSHAAGELHPPALMSNMNMRRKYNDTDAPQTKFREEHKE